MAGKTATSAELNDPFRTPTERNWRLTLFAVGTGRGVEVAATRVEVGVKDGTGEAVGVVVRLVPTNVLKQPSSIKASHFLPASYELLVIKT